MASIMEAITAMLNNFVDDEPKPLLHVGETMSLWTAFTAFHEAHSLYEVGLNMTTDPELRHVLQRVLEGSQADSEMIAKFMISEGVPLPLINSNKPKSNPDAVPEGVKLTEDEIANLIAVKIAASITFCAQSLSQSVRTDVGLMFFQIQVHLMKYAAPLKNIMKKRGWLRVPPKYNPPGNPNADSI